MLVETYWIDVTFWPWALWPPFVWLWQWLGYVPRWPVRIRPCEPPPHRSEW